MSAPGPLPFGLPLEALLWLGLALLVASAVLAVALGMHLGDRRKRRQAGVAKRIIDECMGMDPTTPVPPEPPVGTRVVTREGHMWRRTEDCGWEAVQAPHICASWPVLAGVSARVAAQPRLSPPRAMSAARKAAAVELDDFLADPQGYGGGR